MAQAQTAKTADTSTGSAETKRDLSKYSVPKLLETHKTMSGVIRALAKEGLTRGEISKVTGKRYQHVRNVLITPLTSKPAS
jgi:hypothetical protein